MASFVLDRRTLLTGSAALFAASLKPRPANAATGVAFNDLYEREQVLSPGLQNLAGEVVEMVGYMAPPLKAEARFFVLTRSPMAVCPFCETEMQWPDDIVLVLTDDVIGAVAYNVRIRVTGRLDLGFEKEADTGFVSLIRLEGADFERA